jgi:hypothetical protein
MPLRELSYRTFINAARCIKLNYINVGLICFDVKLTSIRQTASAFFFPLVVH